MRVRVPCESELGVHPKAVANVGTNDANESAKEVLNKAHYQGQKFLWGSSGGSCRLPERVWEAVQAKRIADGASPPSPLCSGFDVHDTPLTTR
jgi:hypothetical protein